MARNQWIEARLQRWAEHLKVGDGSGYPVTNTLHQSWLPPTGGTTPTMKVSTGSRDVRATHRAVVRLSVRLQNTLAVHYIMALPLADQAARLECAVSTVVARIEQAHRQLLALLEPTATN